MPQVAARINEQQERWLKDYFRTKSAGAEFILPWAVRHVFPRDHDHQRHIYRTGTQNHS